MAAQSLPAGAWGRCWWEESPEDSELASLRALDSGTCLWEGGSAGRGRGKAPVPGSMHRHVRCYLIGRVRRRPGSRGWILLLVTKCSSGQVWKMFQEWVLALVWKQMLNCFFFFPLWHSSRRQGRNQTFEPQLLTCVKGLGMMSEEKIPSQGCKDWGKPPPLPLFYIRGNRGPLWGGKEVSQVTQLAGVLLMLETRLATVTKLGPIILNGSIKTWT